MCRQAEDQCSSAAIFNPFHLTAGMYKLIMKTLGHTKKCFFAHLTKKLDIIVIHSHWVAIAVLAVVIFF